LSSRTRRETVVFRRPFTVEGIDRLLPAGAYLLETDEETVDGVSVLAWRRVRTLLYLPSLTISPLPAEMVTVDAREFERAIERDRQGA
jgi:hypothetical protein